MRIVFSCIVGHISKTISEQTQSIRHINDGLGAQETHALMLTLSYIIFLCRETQGDPCLVEERVMEDGF